MLSNRWRPAGWLTLAAACALAAPAAAHAGALMDALSPHARSNATRSCDTGWPTTIAVAISSWTIARRNVGRLDVPVDEAARVDTSEHRGDADRHAKELHHMPRLSKQPAEQFAVRILEQQHRALGSRTSASGRAAYPASSCSRSAYS